MGKLTLNKTPEKSGLTNTGSKQFVKLKLLASIEIAEPFKSIFPIKEALLTTIIEDMRERGFDNSQPLLLWKEQGVLVDGHTRLKAAEEAGIQQVPVFEQSFEDETSAVEYAIHLQKDRRNLDDAELYKCFLELDSRYTQGGDRKSEKIKSSCELLKSNASEEIGRSRDRTAQTLGTSTTKVQKMRTLKDHGDEETKEAIDRGEISINKAYKQTQQERKQQTAPAETKPAPQIAHWDGSTLYLDKEPDSIVAVELKIDLGKKAKEKIRKVVEAHSA